MHQHGRSPHFGRVGQVEVVGGDRADAPGGHQLQDDAPGRDLPFVGVRALQDLVEQVEQRPRRRLLAGAGQVDDGLEPLQLGHEKGDALLQRILHAHTRGQRERRQRQVGGAHRRAHLRQHRVHADGAQQRALAGHVGAGHQEK